MPITTRCSSTFVAPSGKSFVMFGEPHSDNFELYFSLDADEPVRLELCGGNVGFEGDILVFACINFCNPFTNTTGAFKLNTIDYTQPTGWSFDGEQYRLQLNRC